MIFDGPAQCAIAVRAGDVSLQVLAHAGVELLHKGLDDIAEEKDIRKNEDDFMQDRTKNKKILEKSIDKAAYVNVFRRDLLSACAVAGSRTCRRVNKTTREGTDQTRIKHRQKQKNP